VGCFLAATRVKRAFGYDDSLDVFGVHAVGGIIGALLTGLFAAEGLGGAGLGDGNESIIAQLGAQAIGVLSTLVYSGIGSFLILKLVDLVVGLRVTEDAESEGLDLALHDERGYIL
jgi:Amt family ammonium transporter